MSKIKHEAKKKEQILKHPVAVLLLLILILITGLPLRLQNIKLNGYISDDAWWHYRQIKEVVDFGQRLNPDIYEFTTLNRPMTYPPLFHYLVAYLYKLFSKIISLIKFTHYLNILEGMLYILLIYAISYTISKDRIFSLIGALAAAVSQGIIIRARAAELMPFVFGDLFSLAGVLVLLILLKNIKDTPIKKSISLSVIGGVLFGLALLSWNGTVFIYLPLVLFAFLALIINKPRFSKLALGLFGVCFVTIFIIALPWYLSIIHKYGVNPHPKEMSWFMEKYTVLRQVKPFNFYIFTSGIAIFFVPIVFLGTILKRNTLNTFFMFWIILGAIATSTGWRGYVATMPVISAIAISIGLPWIIHFFFKEESRVFTVVFFIIILLVGSVGYRISNLNLRALDQKNPNEIRTNGRGIKMLEFLKSNYPNAVTIDHITWVSEDEAVGSLKMVSGQYLEYLPAGSSEALKDSSRVYLAEEEGAFKIFQKYNAELIIVRRQLLQLPQLTLIFAPPEFSSEDYLRVTKESEESPEVTISFTPNGMKSLFFRMLNRQQLNRFELVYADDDKIAALPFAVVYKVKKQSPP
jgi:hypothetical protein